MCADKEKQLFHFAIVAIGSGTPSLSPGSLARQDNRSLVVLLSSLIWAVNKAALLELS